MSSDENQQPEGQAPRALSQFGLFNLVLTIGLLVFGVVNIFNNIGAFVNPATLVNQVLTQLHATDAKFPELTYATTSVTTTVGSILLTLQGANFGLITWWAFKRMSARKSSFWVPVIGAAISSTLTFITLLGLILSDSTIMNAIIEFSKSQG